jgi:GNAT superfamily N-acetyltransferase
MFVMPDDAGSEDPRRPLVHPEHEALVRELRSWFTTSAPEIGYHVEELWCGYVSEPDEHTRARFVLDVDTPESVQAALVDARRLVGTGEITVWVDDRERAARLGDALRAGGCQPGTATSHLALVGAMAGRRGPEDLVIQDVDEDSIVEWAAVKLQCFGDTEWPPSRERLVTEVAVRRAEWPLVDYKLATIHGERLAVLGYYRGKDQLVFNLGTRVPHRHRGIAQALLANWVDAANADGCRSMMINATEHGQPEALYRRLGFVDEVYWYRQYQLKALGL